MMGGQEPRRVEGGLREGSDRSGMVATSEGWLGM